VLEELQLWIDPLFREGPEAMAVDEWLWMQALVPILRVYQWAGDWMSLGYFGSARRIPEERAFVRRPTGGGVVDHRHDWTYTLIIPRGINLAEMPGNQSYRFIHQALAVALAKENAEVMLTAVDADSSDDFCFQRPVVHDLVNSCGIKIAGAGQRRGLHGLLHQGSVALPTMNPSRAHAFSGELSRHVSVIQIEPDTHGIESICREKYRNKAWNRKRV
jgi:lipoate-protein ligase A